MIRISPQNIPQLGDLLNPETDSESAANSLQTAMIALPRLIGLKGAYAGQVIPLLGTIFMIGRDANYPISAPKDRLLSREHAVLSSDGGHWFCGDLRSLNGTYIDGVRIPTTTPTPLTPGCVLRCGEQEWRMAYPGDPGEALPDSKTSAGRSQDAPKLTRIREDDTFSLESLLFDEELPMRAKPKPSAKTKNVARWVPPGEAVTVGDITLPDGMVYVGTSLPALTNSGEDYALISSELPTTESGPARGLDYAGYYTSYQSIRPLARRRYLQWLADGRGESDLDTNFPQMFFYGLERRLIGPLVSGATRAAKAEPPPGPEEMAALRKELVRLAALEDALSLTERIRDLLDFIDIKKLIDDDVPMALPDPGSVIATSRGYELPALLAFALARMAEDRQPLSADWALAWFLHDPESNLRTPLLRCLNEFRRLFESVFPARVGSKGIRVRLVKTSLTFTYVLANPSCYNNAILSPRAQRDFPEWLRHVSRSPLTTIREIAYSCIYTLDSYSRKVGKDEELRHTLPVAALLPNPLFAESPTIRRFSAYLDALLSEASAGVVPAAAVPMQELLSQWSRRDPVVEPPLPLEEAPNTALTRSEATLLLETADRLGFIVEPDLRLGGPSLLVGKEGDAVAAIARRGENTNYVAPIAVAVGLPLLVRAARVSANAIVAETLRNLAAQLPRASACEPGRFAARLAYLIGNPKECAKLPKRQEPALLTATPEEKEQIADMLVAVVSQSGAVSPAAVTELIRLFALLDLPDSEVYSRLHSSGSVSAGIGKQARGKRSAAKADGATTGVAIDLALVQQKMEESHAIGSLLADIFAEDATGETASIPEETSRLTVTVVAPPAAPASLGALDERHAGLLRALVEKDSWAQAEVAAIARTLGLMPNAAIEAINDAAYERFEEPVLEGEDPVSVILELARELLG